MKKIVSWVICIIVVIVTDRDQTTIEEPVCNSFGSVYVSIL